MWLLGGEKRVKANRQLNLSVWKYVLVGFVVAASGLALVAPCASVSMAQEATATPDRPDPAPTRPGGGPGRDTPEPPTPIPEPTTTPEPTSASKSGSPAATATAVPVLMPTSGGTSDSYILLLLGGLILAVSGLSIGAIRRWPTNVGGRATTTKDG